jgi:hypothetical protein
LRDLSAPGWWELAGKREAALIMGGKEKNEKYTGGYVLDTHYGEVECGYEAGYR